MSTPFTAMPPQDAPAPCAGDGPPHAVHEPGHGRHKRVRTLRFVAVFTVVVLGLLAGYRFTVQTVANDWYLFEVARHTAWVLDRLGYRATLESTFEGGNGAQVRAMLEAWGLGMDEATQEMIDRVSNAPLTPWERYRHRILSSRRNHFIGGVGPRVLFILTPSPQMRAKDLEREIADLEAAAADPADTALLEEKRTELAAARQDAATAKASGDRKTASGYSFIFSVIPECGAFEIMAIFLAAVLGFPTTWRKRLLGLALGMPVLYAVNIARLSCLAIIGALAGSGEWFDFAHNYVWQAIYIVFVVGVWLAWVEYLVKRRRS